MSTADALTCLAFSPDSQKIASGTARSGVTITTISLESKHQLGTLADAHTYVTAIAWSPDGEKIISALPDHTIRCWNTTSTLPIGQPFKGHNDLIFTAGFLPDSSHAISFSRDGELLVWDTGSGVVTQQVTVSNAAQTTFVAALSADSGLLVTTDTKQGVAWEIPKCARIAEIALPDVPLLQAAIIIPNGRPRVVLGFGDRSVWIWDANTGKHEDVRFEGLDKGDIPLAMAVSPDGKLLALEIESDIDHPTHFYDMNGHKLTTSNLRCTHPFAFSPDGKLFAASSIPSDSKDGSHKLIVRSVEEILGGSPLDLPATITLKAKGKQRSLGLNPAFFDQPPPASINTNGRPQASPRTNAKGILPLPKIWQRIRHPRSSEAKSKVREPQQMPPRPASRERATAPLANLWTRIRHRPSHRAASIPILEVPTAQAKRFHVDIGKIPDRSRCRLKARLRHLVTLGIITKKPQPHLCARQLRLSTTWRSHLGKPVNQDIHKATTIEGTGRALVQGSFTRSVIPTVSKRMDAGMFFGIGCATKRCDIACLLVD
ncbi:WD40-repeat-containing domain protein [Suillus bovinus]|uniref:WD40-repeat-containing domain protein n=1 Tax=Suillus bovinus TaxID=48563 RepID=UPI001B871034|nr:WD40-repeat-containing domain protein [Suillus bovinus]KAG2147874.1 WD40-repeat-containing domain protein [Suillus bovinus]